jgi:hypothetical protein
MLALSPRVQVLGTMFAWLCGFATVSQAAGAESFHIAPATVELRGNFAQAPLIVTQGDEAGKVGDRSRDLTRAANFASSDSQVVRVDEAGRLLAVGNGTAHVAVTVGETEQQIPVTVADVVEPPVVGFDQHIRPVLNKAGCSMGACHAAQHGQAGLKLSVFGFDPQADWEAMVRDRQQRRVNLLDPEESLLLKKATMQVPHGGSRRLTRGSVDYQLLTAWIQAGAAGPSEKAPKVSKLNVTPSHRICEVGEHQQLRVEAVYNDGTLRDVTAWTKFDSMDDAVLSVSDDGLVTAIGQGQAPLMVRFEGRAEISLFVIPYQEEVDLADWTNNNFIDELASTKFRELGITPEPLCDDATFIRRAFLDAIGTLPTVEDVQAFIESDQPNKRERLIDRLLGFTGDPHLDIYNDQYAAYWTLKWSDLIRNSSSSLGEQGMWALHNWIKEAFRENRPFDQFVRELVTAKGSIYMSGPANYFRINKNTSELTESTAQLFLGVRLQCAQCHHHPFEKYSEEDYYSFSAFFSRVGTKNSEEFGLFGREQVVVVRSTGDVRHPRTRQLLQPKPLDGEPIDHPLDRRIPLAEWLTSPENEFFARSVVNRYMGYLLGYGLVEPIDDMRATNPPSNVALMNALSEGFVDSGFDLKWLVRTIMTSRLYQLDSQPSPTNAADRRFYSHYKVKRLPAEVLLDAIDVVTGVPTKFRNLPPGTRAIELPDAEYPDYFLNTFGKPKRSSVCECERVPDENLAQALHTLNGDILADKIAGANGRIARLLKAETPHEDIVTELYLTTLCRPPSAAEREAAKRFLEESPSPKECYEDLLWALINSKQFLFVR